MVVIPVAVMEVGRTLGYAARSFLIDCTTPGILAKACHVDLLEPKHCPSTHEKRK